jgi:hypothetical protein
MARPSTIDRIGYCITVGSIDFASQSDHINALQWLCLLRSRNVSSNHIAVWLPQKDIPTIISPSASIGSPPLSIPLDYVHCVNTNPKDGITIIDSLLTNLFLQSDVDRIVWIFLNHGNERSLVFVQEKLIQNLFKCWCKQQFFNGQFQKEFLIVLDSCCSSAFVRKSLQTIKPNIKTWILTAGEGLVYTTMPVFGVPETLVHSFEQFHYSIFSSMFMRKLLRLITYEPDNCPLVELPRLLNGSCPTWKNGFKAEFHTTGNPDIKYLNDFFGFFENVERSVILKGREISINLIIPNISEEQFDDIAVNYDHIPSIHELDNRYVRVGFEDGRVIPIEYQFLDPSNELEKAIIGQFTHVRGNTMRVKREHVPILKLVVTVITNLGEIKDATAYQRWTEECGEIRDWLKDINGCKTKESPYLCYLSPYIEKHSLTVVKEKIWEIRTKILKNQVGEDA